MMLTIS